MQAEGSLRVTRAYTPSWAIAAAPPQGYALPMPQDPYIFEKFTKQRNAARVHIREYRAKYPKDRFETELDSWRDLKQSDLIEYTMKRLRKPVR